MTNLLNDIVQNELLAALDRDERELIDSLSRDAAPFDAVDAESIHLIEAMLGNLELAEMEVLTLSFGLEGDAPAVDEEIASRTGLTADEVAGVRARALMKLRQPNIAAAG